MPATETPHLTLRELERALAAADPAVLLAPSRILRRVIRFDRRLTNLGWDVPHRKSYVISRTRLFEFVSRFELELDVERDLPEILILLERPDDEDLLQQSSGNVLAEYWRLLFHIRIHTELDRLIESAQLSDELVVDRLRMLGSTTYAEIRNVLQRENMLLPPRSDLLTYVEFVAVFLELRYFAAEQLPWWFPAIRDPDVVAAMLARDVDHEAVYAATRLAGAVDRAAIVRIEDEKQNDAATTALPTDPLHPSPPIYWRLIARAERIGSVGNVVKAAILRTKASKKALPERAQESARLAEAELERLARRLQPALELTDHETRDWADAMIPLLEGAHRGLRTAEAKLLYDLQKVCLEHERGVYKLDLFEWVRRGGRSPLRRPLPLLRQVLVTRHLLSAARKLTVARLSGTARTRLQQLIATAVDRAKHLVRDRLRPHISGALSAEGLKPQNVPERVAFRKIVEELLDRIVERGHLSFSHLRDTLSQNSLKLPDLTSLWELLTGDLLLRIDRRLALTLDGVYHRGPIYLRWSQRLSAMAFGTQFGRLVTQHVAIPFGGAYVLFEFIRHIAHLITRSHPHAATVTQPLVGSVPELIETVGQVALLGTFFWLLMHKAQFRRSCINLLYWIGHGLRRAAYDWPMSMLRWPWVRRFLDSPLYVVFVSYMLKPLGLTTLILLPMEIRFKFITWATWAILFLIVNLLVNSPIGRYADEVITEQLMRGWRELQMRVFGAAVRAIIDLFNWLLQTIERLLYTVDEWLRFRMGESRLTIAAKAVLGVVWSLVAYLVRFCVTLLVEPQVNPIKHFPVVTVSHKMIWPLGIPLQKWLESGIGIGTFWAAWVAWATVFLLPGVFGFLVWELKENWRLYRSNRSKILRSIAIGSHGETMLRFLRIGIHSGTVPKLFGKLRMAARKAASTGKWSTVRRHRDALHHVQEKIQHFVERELLALLEESRDWCGIPLTVGEVHLATNRIAVSVVQTEQVASPLVLEFQERAGWIVASVESEGWLDRLSVSDRETFCHGLTGLFKSAGVDIVWQDVIKFVGFESIWYDIAPEGLLFWPQPGQYAAVLYRLRDTGFETPPPVPIRTVVEPSSLELPQLMFGAAPVTWAEWVAMWNGNDEIPEKQEESFAVEGQLRNDFEVRR